MSWAPAGRNVPVSSGAPLVSAARHVAAQATAASAEAGAVRFGMAEGRDDVVQRGAVAWQDLGGAYPDVTVERIHDALVLVLDDARCGDVESRNVDDEIRFAQPPVRPLGIEGC